jgi:hypothetical protein
MWFLASRCNKVVDVGKEEEVHESVRGYKVRLGRPSKSMAREFR